MRYPFWGFRLPPAYCLTLPHLITWRSKLTEHDSRLSASNPKIHFRSIKVIFSTYFFSWLKNDAPCGNRKRRLEVTCITTMGNNHAALMKEGTSGDWSVTRNLWPFQTWDGRWRWWNNPFEAAPGGKGGAKVMVNKRIIFLCPSLKRTRKLIDRNQLVALSLTQVYASQLARDGKYPLFFSTEKILHLMLPRHAPFHCTRLILSVCVCGCW